MRFHISSRPHAKGFTLIEAVMVITITGILGAIVAVFIRKPVEGYFDSARRASLTDTADTAVRRMGRDIGKALPNSIREPDTNSQCVEFIPTRTGGRYRTETDIMGAGDILDFSAADSSFDMFGLNSALPADQQIQDGDMIAVYNLGIPGSDAYNADNTSAVAASGVTAGVLANESNIAIASKLFPLASGGNRFHVIPGNEKIVSFVCSGGKLYRNSNYAYATSCPTTGAVLADHVSACTFSYDAVDMRNGLVRIALVLSSGGETVNLYHEVHVNNTP